MKALLVTSPGLEDVAALEAKELVGSKSRKIAGGVVVSVKNHFQLCELCYTMQSISKVVLLTDVLSLRDVGKLNWKKLESWLGEESFRVRGKSLDDLSSTELEGRVGEVLTKHLKNKVDLPLPAVEVFVLLSSGQCYVGIDFSGTDLSKRDYKIFSTRQSVKGTLAYFLLRFADYKKNHVIVDPFCDVGEIVIEAASFKTGFSVNYFRRLNLAFTKFDNLKFDALFTKPKQKTKQTVFGFSTLLDNVKKAQKNAKIAGLNKAITLSKVEVGFLELKFKPKTVDRIVTKIFVSKYFKSKHIDELFYQAEYVLKKTGKVAVLTNDASQFLASAQKYGFKVEKEQKVWAGKRELIALLFTFR